MPFQGLEHHVGVTDNILRPQDLSPPNCCQSHHEDHPDSPSQTSSACSAKAEGSYQLQLGCIVFYPAKK